MPVAAPLWSRSAGLVAGCKDFASERKRELALKLASPVVPLNLLQRYGEFLIPPNKITNIFQLFYRGGKYHIAKLCEPYVRT